ncbi:MAG: hypothetical protein AB7U75_03185 [Hyphomicrobiaceae bacterium]
MPKPRFQHARAGRHWPTMLRCWNSLRACDHWDMLSGGPQRFGVKNIFETMDWSVSVFPRAVNTAWCRDREIRLVLQREPDEFRASDDTGNINDMARFGSRNPPRHPAKKYAADFAIITLVFWIERLISGRRSSNDRESRTQTKEC